MNAITYENEVSDLRAFNLHLLRTSAVGWVPMILLLLLLIGLDLNWALGLPLSMTGRLLQFAVMLGIHLAGVACLMVVLGWLTFWLVFRGPQPGILGRHTITLTPQGVREETDVNEAQVIWSGIHRVAATAKHVFIYVQRHGGHAIPRRAFPSPEAAEQFLATARSFHAAAKTTGG